MGIFDRRKDAKAGHLPEVEAESPPELSTAPSPPAPVEPDVQEGRVPEEPKVAAAPPAPPKPEAAEPLRDPEPSAPPAPTTEQSTQIHTVTPGETLADLASRYGVAPEEIARQNHVPAPGQIYPGQVLVIGS